MYYYLTKPLSLFH